MKRFSILSTLFITAGLVVDARLGETREQCVERYGSDTGLGDVEYQVEGTSVSHHRKNGVSIEIQYFENVACQIEYMRGAEMKRSGTEEFRFSPSEIEGLIEKNVEASMVRRKDKDLLPWKIEKYGQSDHTVTEFWESEDRKFTCEYERTYLEPPVIGMFYTATVTIADNAVAHELRDTWLAEKMRESQAQERSKAKSTLDGL